VQLASLFFVSWNDGGGNVSRYIAWPCDFFGYQNWEDPFRKVPSSLVAKFLEYCRKDDGGLQEFGLSNNNQGRHLGSPYNLQDIKECSVVTTLISFQCELGEGVKIPPLSVSFVHNGVKFEAYL
jgi:hypothetical protein